MLPLPLNFFFPHPGRCCIVSTASAAASLRQYPCRHPAELSVYRFGDYLPPGHCLEAPLPPRRSIFPIARRCPVRHTFKCLGSAYDLDIFKLITHCIMYIDIMFAVGYTSLKSLATSRVALDRDTLEAAFAPKPRGLADRWTVANPARFWKR